MLFMWGNVYGTERHSWACGPQGAGGGTAGVGRGRVAGTTGGWRNRGRVAAIARGQRGPRAACGGTRAMGGVGPACVGGRRAAHRWRCPARGPCRPVSAGARPVDGGWRVRRPVRVPCPPARGSPVAAPDPVADVRRRVAPRATW